jgi:hypothetical protein
MNETQESISLWAEETFGPVGSNARVAARANEEMAELIIDAADWDTPDKPMIKECADVAIVLCRLACRMGFELRLEIFPHEHNLINRNRSAHDVVAKANLAMSKLLRALTANDSSPSAEAYANECMVMLLHLPYFTRYSLGSMIDEKMAINRAREWRLDNTGHGYHVRDESAGGISQREI